MRSSAAMRTLPAVMLALVAALPATAADSLLALPGLAAPVRVVTDRYGIPHLRAQSRGDLYLAWGFVTARDRMAQLEFLRRAARGELSHLIGNRGLRPDGGARLFELARHGARMWGEIPPGSSEAAAVRRYCEGINAYVAAHRATGRPWPREFWIWRKQPSAWSPEDVLAVTLAQGLLLDLYYPQLDRAALPPDDLGNRPDSLYRLLEGLRYDTIQPDAARALYRSGGPAGGLPPEPDGADRHALAAAREDPTLAAAARRALDHLREGFAEVGLAPGASNAFAVGGWRSASGAGLFANDPHLRLTAPGFWHVVHLTVPDTLDAAGACVPGVPGMTSGRNRDVAWGITALSGQAMEVYADTLDPSRTHTRWRGGWAPVRREAYGLRYRRFGLRLPIPGLVRRYTVHGPVLKWDRKRRLAYSIRWAAAEAPGDLGVIGIEGSRSLEELRGHLLRLVTPTLNVIAADRSGGLLYQVAGRMPLRRYAIPWGPTPGAGEHEWQGLIPAAEMPWQRDPPEGFLVSGNNRPVGEPYPYFLGYFDWGNDRARRMAQRLEGDSLVTFRDMASVQGDVYSREAERLLPNLLRHGDSLHDQLTPLARASLDTLRTWDRLTRRGRVAPTLYRSWVATLRRAARLADYDYVLQAALDGRAPGLLLRADSSRSPAAVVVRALEDGLAALIPTLGADPSRWTWDRAHRARFAHQLEWKDPQLSPPPVPADGDNGTVSVGVSGLPQRTTYAFGPSYRHVVDLAVADSSWVVVPPGNWGDQQSPHGRDHLPLWQQHGYAPLYLDWARVEDAAESVLVLSPSRRQ